VALFWISHPCGNADLRSLMEERLDALESQIRRVRWTSACGRARESSAAWLDDEKSAGEPVAKALHRLHNRPPERARNFSSAAPACASATADTSWPAARNAWMTA
jgi:hypothetical protein